MFSKELIAELMKGCPHTNDLPAHLAAGLNRVRAIKNQVSDVHADIAKAKEEYEAKKKALYDKLQKLRESCKHETRSFHSDPAGGRDSYHECDVCGKGL